MKEGQPRLRLFNAFHCTTRTFWLAPYVISDGLPGSASWGTPLALNQAPGSFFRGFPLYNHIILPAESKVKHYFEKFSKENPAL